MPERAKELHDELAAWRKSVNAPMPKKREEMTATGGVVVIL